LCLNFLLPANFTFLVSLLFYALTLPRLWHQLTIKVMEFMALPSAKPFLIQLYEGFIQAWESKMNKSSLVQIMIVTARQYAGMSFFSAIDHSCKFPFLDFFCLDSRTAIQFLESIAKKVEDEKEAYVLAVMEAAHFKLVLNEMQGTRDAVEECEKILDALPGVDPVVHASFYRVSADYHKVRFCYSIGTRSRTCHALFYLYLFCCRPKHSMHNSTKMHCFSWLVSTWMIYLLQKKSNVLMTCALLPY
jgi:hypothetical protein